MFKFEQLRLLKVFNFSGTTHQRKVKTIFFPKFSDCCRQFRKFYEFSSHKEANNESKKNEKP